MTCASCAVRVEKQLNKLAGVTATVNLATETAAVSSPVTLNPGDLIAAVERAGYTARVPVGPSDPAEPSASAEPSSPAEPASRTGRAQGTRTQGTRTQGTRAQDLLRLPICLVLAVPVLLLAMVPAWQFRGWS